MMQAPAARVEIRLKVAPKVHHRLSVAAQRAGMPTSTYALLLFEAAYAARVGQERGDEPVDAELDEQVRLVFALAGQADAEAIAKATGVPAARVKKILEGFRKVKAA